MKSIIAIASITAALCASLGASPARPDDDAFCKDCPVTRRTLDKEELVNGVFCKPGTELGVDASNRTVFCTTSRAIAVGGLPIAGDSYTLFHRNGRIYQSSIRTRITRATGGGIEVACAAGGIVLHPDGSLEDCTLADKLAIKPRPRVGQIVEFHRDGQIAAMIVDEPIKIGTFTWPAGTGILWSSAGVPEGGHTNGKITIRGLWIYGEIKFHPSGNLRVVELDKPATISGHAFAAQAKIGLRDDGTLESAEYVSKQGFMIHGEPWTDTNHDVFDHDGKLVSSHTTRWQSEARPPKFNR